MTEGHPSDNVKPDGYGTVCANLTYPNGLMVTLESDGSITQQLDQPIPDDHGVVEVSRMVTGRGTVIRQLNGHEEVSMHIMYFNGNTGYLYHDGSFEVDSMDGRRRMFSSTSEEYELEPISVRCVTDPQSRESIKIREDKLIGGNIYIVTALDGNIRIRHSDGTAIKRRLKPTDPSLPSTSEAKQTSSQRTSSTSPQSETNGTLLPDEDIEVKVMKNGFADVVVYPDRQVLCYRHSQGQRIPIRQSAKYVRCMISYEGLSGYIAYDTRATAEVSCM